jgi:hypothetical protein
VLPLYGFLLRDDSDSIGVSRPENTASFNATILDRDRNTPRMTGKNYNFVTIIMKFKVS